MEGYFDIYTGSVKSTTKDSALEAVKFVSHIFRFRTKEPKNVMSQLGKTWFNCQPNSTMKDHCSKKKRGGLEILRIVRQILSYRGSVRKWWKSKLGRCNSFRSIQSEELYDIHFRLRTNSFIPVYQMKSCLYQLFRLRTNIMWYSVRCSGCSVYEHR